MLKQVILESEAKAWLKRKNGPDEIIRVLPDHQKSAGTQCYHLYTAFDTDPDDLGCILFDNEGYWIYDGQLLTVDEQEQLAQFIIHYIDRM